MTTILTLLVAAVVALALRGPGVVIGLVLVAVAFVPLERAFPLRRQKVFRRSLATDLTHFLLDTTIVGVLTIAFVVVAVVPFLWLRALHVAALLPGFVAVPLAVVLVVVGQYWGHRCTHQVPFLWRFHAVHHSIEQMDWVASARLHPVDQAFTQAFTVLPLVLLGYGRVAVGGVAIVVTLLALFQHANVRLRFPGIRWVLPTPEWHHWHHALDPDARDTNFGLPLVDRCFGTAYLPKRARPIGFGTADLVPQDGYVRQLAYPFRRRVSHPPAVGPHLVGAG